MAYTGRFGQSDDFRREELIRIIEHSVENLTLQELEALYYDMSTKNYINGRSSESRQGDRGKWRSNGRLRILSYGGTARWLCRTGEALSLSKSSWQRIWFKVRILPIEEKGSHF